MRKKKQIDTIPDANDIVLVENLLRVNAHLKGSEGIGKWFYPYYDSLTGKLTYIRLMNIKERQMEMPSGASRFIPIMDGSIRKLIMDHRKRLKAIRLKNMKRREERRAMKILEREKRLNQLSIDFN